VWANRMTRWNDGEWAKISGGRVYDGKTAGAIKLLPSMSVACGVAATSRTITSINKRPIVANEISAAGHQRALGDNNNVVAC